VLSCCHASIQTVPFSVAISSGGVNRNQQFQAPRKALKTFGAAGSYQDLPSGIGNGVPTRFPLPIRAF
jgi:hypothetical protein